MEKLLFAFHNINTNETTDVIVTLVNEQEQEINYTIKNNAYIQNEVERIKNNYENLLNSDPSYLLNGDGTMSKFIRTDYTNTGYVKNLEASTNCVISYDSIIDNLTFPNVKLPIKIDNSIVENEILAHVYTITSGFEEIFDDIDIHRLEYLIQSKTIYATKKTINLETKRQQINTNGEFDVISVLPTEDENIFVVQTNTTIYKQLTVNSNLIIGDILVDELSKYELIDIDSINNILKLKRIAGNSVPQVGISQLKFNAIVTIDEKYVDVPVLPNKQIAILLSTKNNLSISFPSKVIKIDTSDLSVTTDEDGEITLQQYYEKYVTNITEYFESLVNDSSIPLSLGIKPSTITLDARNFNVMQINKHLTNKLTREELEKLNSEKVQIANNIDFKNNEIQQLERELSTSTLKTTDEIDNRNQRIKLNREEIATLSQNLLIVTRKIDDNAIKYGLKSSKAKYRVIGFANLLDDILSTKTRAQKIIKYEFWYRYLSKNTDEVSAATYKLYNGDDSQNITISPWNIADSKTLQKVKNEVTGKFDWVDSRLDSSEDININQCNIGINEGESIEIKVRAISEAGAPVSTLAGDWSNILRVDFPADLTENSVNLLINKNVADLKVAEFQAIIRESGMYEHINDGVSDGQIKYKHHAGFIASGFYTDERRIIPVFDMLLQINNRLESIETQKSTENIGIEFVDFNKTEYVIENNTTLQINAGAYNDKINLLDNSNFGEIVKLTNYIKITNKNDTPVEIKTLIPGTGELDSVNNSKYFNVPILGKTSYKQNKKQIIYFRNIDITNQESSDFQLYAEPLGKTSTVIANTLIDESASDIDKNIIYLSGADSIVKCKLLSNDNLSFVAFRSDHPLYDINSALKINELKNEFYRLAKINSNAKLIGKQEKLNDDIYLGFTGNDKYAIGSNTTGAFLYPIFNNEEKLQVVGNTTISSVIIQKNSEIIIPVIYEYRMTDALGIINGDPTLSVTDNIEYKKKIGIDLLINNESISFDLEFSSKLKNDVTSIETLNIPGITSNI